jgi:hypothetical protein
MKKAMHPIEIDTTRNAYAAPQLRWTRCIDVFNPQAVLLLQPEEFDRSPPPCPRSGLDSYTAERLLAVLKQYARGDEDGGGKLVVLSVHQPSQSNFELFDSVSAPMQAQRRRS